MKPTPNDAKAGRFDLRLNPMEKQRIQSAAALKGQQVSVFIREIMLREADAILAAHAASQLDAEQTRRFMAALDAPFAPNEKLARALARTGR
ncbi:hypothetical protein LYSHEL_05580 [Lysobacter helvus]|uniref:DUF1778 domain-containing protein n=2 Tax=Lysobacteraceae TaxID=32033 RepID=A0ABN6FPL2_9GAMM|nr:MULTISPECIES: DUF1778 domain-containing protein [Lysobacter]BCT91534.1 hypothetical protein LYSCAS_05580 [Lysobacter caseinilyticus]BCT94687.1 hypothetical protein LYSHEL_05580 [Lysobacter helvus]